MQHQNFYHQYASIQEEEVRELNEVLRNRTDKEFHWYTDFPYVIADLSTCDGHVDAKVMAVKYPITLSSGILIIPDEDNEIGLTSTMKSCPILNPNRSLDHNM